MDERLKDAFDYAITTGNTEVFAALAKNFSSFEQEDRNWLLTRTITNTQSTTLIQHVLDYGYSLDYKGNDGATLLHYAAASDHPEVVRFFIERGLDVNAKDNDSWTPLIAAATNTDSVEVLKALIDAGADTAVTDEGWTLLHIAAAFNPAPTITKFFLEQGFDTECRNERGFTPLMEAVSFQSNLDVIELLLDAGKDIAATNERGQTLLHLAAMNDESDVVRYLLPAFDATDTDSNGISCLGSALMCGTSPDTVEMLLQSMKAEHMRLACWNENPEILEALIRAGYDVNMTNPSGVTTLMWAAYLNTSPNIIKMLSHHHAIWSAVDDEGRNVLHYAAANENPAIYDWMLETEGVETLKGQTDVNGHEPAYYYEHRDEF